MYPTDTVFYIANLSITHEDGETFVGPDKSGAFVVVTPDVHQVMVFIDQGLTYGQICDKFEIAPGHDALDEVLHTLETKCLISTNADLFPKVSESQASAKFDFAQRVGAAMFSSPALVVYSVLTSIAILLCMDDHEVFPTSKSLIFHSYKSLSILFVTVVSFVTVGIHELGHMLAGRAVGVRSKFSLGTRLWILVAETDLSGLWGVPRKKRYIPLLAGMILDIVSASILICCVKLLRSMSINHIERIQHILLAIIFSYILRLIWQFFFFLRTDLYYVFASALRCTNLMYYTQQYLRTILNRAHKQAVLDQIPKRELRVVRYYAGFWMLGQIASIILLIFVSLPITIRYIFAGVTVMRFHSSESFWIVADNTAITMMTVIPWAVGLFIWGKSLIKRRAWGA